MLFSLGVLFLSFVVRLCASFCSCLCSFFGVVFSPLQSFCYQLYDFFVYCSHLCGSSFVCCSRLCGSLFMCCSRLCGSFQVLAFFGSSFPCCLRLCLFSLVCCSRLCGSFVCCSRLCGPSLVCLLSPLWSFLGILLPLYVPFRSCGPSFVVFLGSGFSFCGVVLPWYVVFAFVVHLLCDVPSL